jgi:hypothetical protein
MQGKNMSQPADELSNMRLLQLQAYCYEYQAMMNRMTWFMTMQFVPLVPLGALVTVGVSNFGDPLLVSWSAFGAQIGD